MKMEMSTPPAPIEVLKYTITGSGGNKGKIKLAWGGQVGNRYR